MGVFIRNRFFPAVEEIVQKQGDSLVDGVPGYVEANQLVYQGIGFGIGADTDTKPTIRADIFPIRKTGFLVDGPVFESS